MASSGKNKRKNRGLNVKVDKSSESLKSGDVHVNSYQKRARKTTAKSNKKAESKTDAKAADIKAEAKNDTKATSKKTTSAKSATKKPASFSRASNNSKSEKTEKVEKIEKAGKDEKVEKVVAKKTEDIKKAEEVKKATETAKSEKKVESEKAEEKTTEAKEVKAEKVEKVEEKKEEKEVKTEKVVASKKDTAEEVSEAKTEADTKPEVKSEDKNFSEFETLKIEPKETEAVSKIILRDVAEDKLAAKLEAEQKKAEAKAAEEARAAEEAKEAVKAESQPAAIIMPTPKLDLDKINRAVRERNEALNPQPAQPRMTAAEIKNREIEKAISKAAKLPTDKKHARKNSLFYEFGWQRVVLALCCAATAVFAIAYFVNINSADISLKVAAMQSGIEASYPSYVPRGYSLSDVTSSSGKVTMNFKTEDGAFSLSEESSTWDSNALLQNYIKDTYDEDYTVVREQGLTLYMGNDWEAWVNGGVLYKLKVTTGSLTKKQMKTIATSL